MQAWSFLWWGHFYVSILGILFTMWMFPFYPSLAIWGVALVALGGLMSIWGAAIAPLGKMANAW